MRGAFRLPAATLWRGFPAAAGLTVEAAKSEAGQMVELAQRTIRAEQDKAIAAIRNEVVDLSLSAASKVLDRNVGGEDDRRFVSQIVAGGRPGIGRG
jgi:F0F1-type ATP synthase membrane subunit b/b'